MKTKNIPRREKERLIHRQQILDTALDLFSEKGYHNVSMHEIAGRAEFAVGTLYKFFKNKEALYKALLLEYVGKFQKRLQAAINIPGDEITRINNYIRAKGDVFMDNVRVVKLYFAEARGINFNIKAGLDDDIKKVYDDFMEELAGVFKRGIKKRLFRNIDPYYLALAIENLTNTFLFSWVDDPRRHDYRKNEETIKKIFFGKILIK